MIKSNDIFEAAWLRKCEETEKCFDEERGLISEIVCGINYHTAITGGIVHRTRENAEWLPALYKLGADKLVERADKILNMLLELQDQNPESETYGVWPYLWEEPLDKMKNPDWNWAPFMARVLITLLYEFPDRFSGTFKERILYAIKCACECICRRNMGVDYTNISLMSSFVLVAGGELLGENIYVEKGVDTLTKQVEFVSKNGGFAEYNSPYYGVIDIEETGRGLRYFKNAAARENVKKLHEACWQVFAHHYHAKTKQIAPPHARCYADIQNSRIVTLLQLGLKGECRLIDNDQMDVDLLWPFIDLECPQEFIPFFSPKEAARVEKEHFYQGFDPIANDEVRVLIEKGTPIMQSYTYLHPEYCLGTFDRHDMWNQRRPLMGYFSQSDRRGAKMKAPQRARLAASTPVAYLNNPPQAEHLRSL